jgi:hypothetical protein
LAETAPIIVTALFAEADFNWLDGLRRAHFPPSRNILPAHLTLFHHLAPSLADELGRRLDQAARAAPPRAAAQDIRNLGGGTAIAIRSPELEAIRRDLAEAFDDCLTPQDRAGWRPHVTIQNKVTPAAARALQAQLADGFRPRPLRVVALAAWWYRGGPWAALSRHPFRG